MLNWIQDNRLTVVCIVVGLLLVLGGGIRLMFTLKLTGHTNYSTWGVFICAFATASVALWASVEQSAVQTRKDKEDSEALKWETRTSGIRRSVLEHLVAYSEWGENLRENQAIAIGSNNRQDYGQIHYHALKSMLRETGFANEGMVGSGVPVGSAVKPSPSYSTFFVTTEGKELVEYLKKQPEYDQRVVQLWRTKPGKPMPSLVELLWSSIPGDKLGPPTHPHLTPGEQPGD
jgi:hypothetical protein